MGKEQEYFEENFNMDIFDGDEDVSLNLEEDNPFKQDTNESDEDKSGSDDKTDEDNNDTNTDKGKEGNDDPESVVGKDNKDDEEESDSETDDSSPDIFTSFATLLAEKGLLSSFNSEDTKIESEDDLANLVKQEIETNSQNYLKEKIGEEGVEALEKGVSLAEYQQYKNNVETLDQVDEEALENNIELSKKIILEDYKAQGISEDRATRILNKSIELGDDAVLEDARESLVSLKEFQKVQFEKQKEARAQEQVERQKQQEKIDNDLKNSVYNTEEIIEGVKVNKEIKDRMYNTMTKIVSKDSNGTPENELMKTRRENPIEFDTKLYYLYEITKGFKDFSKLINTTKSKVTSDFEEVLRKNKRFENSGTPDFLNDSESYDNLGDELKLN